MDHSFTMVIDGLLNGFLNAIGLGGLQQMWLANKETAMLCIIIVIMMAVCWLSYGNSVGCNEKY